MVSENLFTHGYVVVRHVLTPSEVARLRSEIHAVLDQKGKQIDGSSVLPNAAAAAPSLAWIFTHERILEAVKAKTQMERLVFTAEADLHRNFLLGVWHKDSGEGNMPNGYFDCDAMSSDECLVYKVALYLQDHLDGSGLTVRPGTMLTSSLDEGDEQSVAVRAGDMILFDVRLTHRGTQPTTFDLAMNRVGEIINWKWFQKAPPLVRRWKYRLMGKPDRLAVYFAFGAPNAKSETFANRNMQRQLRQLNLTEFRLSGELRRAFASSDVSVAAISPWSE